MKEEEKYKFNVLDPNSWIKMPTPYLPDWFKDEVRRIGGLNNHGKPRFRCEWAFKLRYYAEGDNVKSLKYHLGKNERNGGYSYLRNGITCYAASMEGVPADAIAVPIVIEEPIGRPHWVMEEWREKGDANGAFSRSDYYWIRWIERDDLPDNPVTYLKPYRAPDNRDLEFLKHYVQLSAKLSDADIKRGVAEDRAREAEQAEAIKAERQDEFAESLVEIITDMPKTNMPEPNKADVARAWKQLEERTAATTNI